MAKGSGWPSKGFTLVEMLVVTAILAVLAMAVIPIAKTAIKREKEIELHRSLRLIREAIDAHKKLADEKKIQVEEHSFGYPPDLETLVKGIEIQGQPSQPGSPAQPSEGKKIMRFLRRIPKDPMTNSTEWGLRSYEDDRDSEVWGGKNVYDVYTKSRATALDGTRYRDW